MTTPEKHFCTVLEPIEYEVPEIYVGVGAIIPLHKASRPMIKALRRKFHENVRSLDITAKGLEFLFAYDGFSKLEEPNERP